MTPLAEVRVPVHLDRDRSLICNSNTMQAFDEESARGPRGEEGRLFYWDEMLKIFARNDAAFATLTSHEGPDGKRFYTGAEAFVAYTKVIRQTPARIFNLMLWAMLHTYDPVTGEPVWDLTPTQVGRLVKPASSPLLIQQMVLAHSANAPDREELGEASGAAVKIPTSAEATPPAVQEPGGENITELLAAALV